MLSGDKGVRGPWLSPGRDCARSAARLHICLLGRKEAGNRASCALFARERKRVCALRSLYRIPFECLCPPTPRHRCSASGLEK